MKKLYVALACFFLLGIGVAIASNVVDLREIFLVEIDGVTPEDGLLPVQSIDYEHFETHEGNHYFLKTFSENTGGQGTSDYFAFTTPLSNITRIHARVWLAPDIDYTITIYENATTTGGTPVPGFNNDRDSNNTALLLPVGAPTVNDIGYPIWVSRNGGGRNPVGVTPGNNYEIIAKGDTTYLFELTKEVTADGIVNIDFWWIEDE